MTYHSHSKWTFDDEPTDAVAEEVVEGLEYHKQYNQDERYTPDAYGTFSDVDALIFQIGIFLDAHKKRKITSEDLDRFLAQATEPGKVVTRKVLASLKVYDEGGDKSGSSR